MREYRVLRALDGGPVPHPPSVLSCDDASVIGAPFFLMDRVDGVSLAHPLPAPFDGQSEVAEVCLTLVDGIADLHVFDWRSAGLDGFGRPAGYTGRQVDRWMSQLEQYRFRPLVDLDRTAEWLRSRVPAQRHDSLIHGDYGLHNVLLGPDLPAQVAAILDWETSTLGDPLADLGYFLAFWLDPGEVRQWSFTGLWRQPGALTREAMVDRYEKRTGFVVEDLRWYRAVAHLKNAIILEGAYVKHLHGGSDDPLHATFGELVPEMAAHALAVTRGDA